MVKVLNGVLVLIRITSSIDTIKTVSYFIFWTEMLQVIISSIKLHYFKNLMGIKLIMMLWMQRLMVVGFLEHEDFRKSDALKAARLFLESTCGQPAYRTEHI